MRAVFIGNVQFSARMLAVPLECEAVDIVGLVTSGKSSINADAVDLQVLVQGSNCPVHLNGNLEKTRCAT